MRFFHSLRTFARIPVIIANTALTAHRIKFTSAYTSEPYAPPHSGTSMSPSIMVGTPLSLICSRTFSSVGACTRAVSFRHHAGYF